MLPIAERRGLERGLIQGKQQTIEVALELRFGYSVSTLQQRVQQVNNLDRLQQLLQIAKSAPLAKVAAVIASPTE